MLAVVHAAAMGLCAGVIVATGVAAAIAFPTMRTLAPTLPDYAAVDEHWMIAAGSVMIRVFSVATVIAAVCVVIGLLSSSCELLRARHRRGVAVALRGGALVLLIGVMTHFTGFVLPRMNRAFNDFRQAAVAGEIERAEASRSAFSEDHPLASRELGAIAVLSLATSILAAAPLARRRR